MVFFLSFIYKQWRPRYLSVQIQPLDPQDSLLRRPCTKVLLPDLTKTAGLRYTPSSACLTSSCNRTTGQDPFAKERRPSSSTEVPSTRTEAGPNWPWLVSIVAYMYVLTVVCPYLCNIPRRCSLSGKTPSSLLWDLIFHLFFIKFQFAGLVNLGIPTYATAVFHAKYLSANSRVYYYSYEHVPGDKVITTKEDITEPIFTYGLISFLPVNLSVEIRVPRYASLSKYIQTSVAAGVLVVYTTLSNW
jgi:hypothetical protein